MFADDPLSLPDYLIVTSNHLVTSNFPIKMLVARQWQTIAHITGHATNLLSSALNYWEHQGVM